MNILVVSQCFYPDNYHINHIVQDMCSRGHTVTVVTGKPDYATSRVPKEYKWFRKHHEYLGTVEVWRVPIFARRHGAIMRFFNYLSFIITGSIFCSFKNFNSFDVIYIWGASPITMAIPAIVLKYRYKKPIFYYCLDLWPESMKAFNVGEKNIVFRTVKILCKWIYSKFDKVAVTSKPFIEYIKTVNEYNKDITYLPQYGADEYLDKNFTTTDNGIVDFVWAGNIGYVQNIETLINAVEKIKDEPNFIVHIVGDGSAKKHYEELVNKKQLNNKIIFYGRVPFADMEKYYKLADACLLTLDGSNKIGETLPVKMQGYMAAGKPVIAAINGAGQQTIKESNCGLVVDYNDSEGLANIMLNFIKNKEKYSSCGENARKYFKENFTKEKHFEVLEQLLNHLI